MISHKLQNNLGLLGLEENDTSKIHQENNKSLTNKSGEQENHNMDKLTTFPLNDKDIENTSECSSSSFNESMQ